MKEKIQQKLAPVARNIEARPQSEKIIVLVMLFAGLVLAYLSISYDPLTEQVRQARNQIRSVERQIANQQIDYAEMMEASQEDPNKFANDRLAVIGREQAVLDQEIASLAGDLVTPNQMTQILTTVLERQAGLELVHFQNKPATALRTGVSNREELLAETGTVNFDDVVEENVAGQVYEHGLTLEFQGDYFNTLKYLRFLEEITGSFFWDGITFRQLDWPNAHVTLEIHTLSTDEGFIGV